MQRNTPLDYAEFLLTRSHTRCELQISANGIKEKLASGYFKPFLAHLRAAEEQFAKGNQVIRLERPSNLLKKNKVTWFTKGTLERFVRFVSTPEVLECVKIIEDELSQLEDVRIALSKTFSQREVPFQAVDPTYSPSGVYQARGSGLSVTRQKPLLDSDNNKADTSKTELLRAMDVRLVALKREQVVAFSRAEAVGFDSSNMSDLLDFSEHFGADRLRDACIHFISLFRLRTAAPEVMEESESPLADGASSGSDMSLESRTDFEPIGECQLDIPLYGEVWPKSLYSGVEKSTGFVRKPGMKEEKNVSADCTSARTRSRWGPPERIQINYMDPDVHSLQGSDISRKTGDVKHQGESYTHQDDYIQSENAFAEVTPVRQTGDKLDLITVLDKPSSLIKKPFFSETSGLSLSSPTAKEHLSDGINKESIFYSRLQKMVQQVEARRSNEDIGIHFSSVQISDESPGSQLPAFGRSSSGLDPAPKSSESISSAILPDRGFSQPSMQERIAVPGHLCTGKSSTLEDQFTAISPRVGNPSSTATSDRGIEDEAEERKKDVPKPREINEYDESKDDKEKSVSTSARRLSVQAAINLFEGKKASVGEPLTRTLVRQDSKKGAAQRQGSQKGPTESAGVMSEKSVLRRWSAVGSNSMKDIQDKARDLTLKGSGRAVETEHTKLKQETMFGNRACQVETEQMHSTQANQFLQKAVPPDTSAEPASPDAPNLKNRSAARAPALAQQQPFVGSSALLSVEESQKQLTKELEQSLEIKAQNIAGVDNVLSAKTAGTDQSLPSGSFAGASRASGVTQTKHLDPENRDTEFVFVGSKGLPKLRDHVGNEEKQKIIPELLGESDKASRRQPGIKKDKVDHASLDTLQNCSLKHGCENFSENSFMIGNSGKGEKQLSLALHDTPVDLYMQALVMMIDQHHQSSLISRDDNSQKQQTGRCYEHYVRLRSARRRNEHPAKRAEKEAKLRSMKEIFEQRKAELEAGTLQQIRKGNNLVKEQKYKIQKSGPSIAQRKEEELGEREVGQQEQQLSKQHVPEIKAEVTKKPVQRLLRSASASRTMTMLTKTASLSTVPKNSTGSRVMFNRCNVTAFNFNGLMDKEPAPMDSSFNTAISGEAHEIMKGPSARVDSTAAVVDHKSAAATADALHSASDVGFHGQLFVTKRNETLIGTGKSSYGHALDQVVLESFKGPQEIGADTVRSCGEQIMKLSLHEGQAQGADEIKQKFLNNRHSSQKYNFEAVLGSNGNEKAMLHISTGSKEDADLRMSIHADVNDTANSRVSTALTTYVCEDANHIERDLYVAEQEGKQLSDDKSLVKSGYGDRISDREKCSVILDEKMTEFSQSDTNSSPSVLQDYTTSTYSDAIASPDNFLEEHTGPSVGTYTPNLALPSDSPLFSPLSLKSSKYLSESNSPHGSPQKLVFTASQQAIKESARGFKRLLHFGRKNRASEAISTTDGISAFTSEGDQEAEGTKELMRQSSAAELLGLVKLEKNGSQRGVNKDRHVFQEQERATISRRSSIPMLYGNSKLQDDHSFRGSSFKASRSLFSLSTFRSKGSEGKAR